MVSLDFFPPFHTLSCMLKPWKRMKTQGLMANDIRILASIEAGTRVPEAQYSILHLASQGQPSVRGIFRPLKPNSRSFEGDVEAKGGGQGHADSEHADREMRDSIQFAV